MILGTIKYPIAGNPSDKYTLSLFQVGQKVSDIAVQVTPIPLGNLLSVDLTIIRKVKAHKLGTIRGHRPRVCAQISNNFD